MKKLFVSQILAEVESLQELLDNQGIPCTVKNQQGSNLAGEVPFAEVFPELWVLNDSDLPTAQSILDDWKDAQPVETTDWVCTNCGESHSREFTTCWNCNQERQSS